MKKLMMGCALLCGTLLSAVSSANQTTLPKLPGKYVQIAGKPSLKGLKERTQMGGPDNGYKIWSKGNQIKYVQTYADDGILPGPFFQKLAKNANPDIGNIWTK